MELINKKMYLSTKDIAKLFNVHLVTVYRWEKMKFFQADLKTFQGHKLYSLENIEKTLMKRFGEKYGKEMYTDIINKINENEN